MRKLKLKRSHVKTVVSFVVGSGTTKLVGDIIENNTDYEDKTDKVRVYAASTVLGWMVADAATKYTDRLVDETADKMQEIADLVKKQKTT